MDLSSYLKTLATSLKMEKELQGKKWRWPLETGEDKEMDHPQSLQKPPIPADSSLPQLEDNKCVPR